MVSERWIRITMGVVLAAAGAYLLYRLRFVLITVTLAAMLAYALLPLVEAALRVRVAGRPLPRLTAVIAVFVLVSLLITGMVSAAAGPMGDQVKRLAANLRQYRDEWGIALTRFRVSIEDSLPPDFRQTFEDALARASTLVVDALGHIVSATADWLAHVVEIILVPILAFYFLVDLPTLKHELLQFLPVGARRPVLLVAHRLDRILAGYVRGQIILMFIAGIMVWAILLLLRVPFPLLLGIVAGLTRAIPIIGPVLGAVPIVGLAMLQSVPVGVTVLVFFAVLQLVESKLILPLVLGRQLGVHAATIILALLLGNATFGLVGMFLAAPVAASVKEVLELAQQGFVEPAKTPDPVLVKPRS